MTSFPVFYNDFYSAATSWWSFWMPRVDSGGRRTCSTSNNVARDGVEGGRVILDVAWCYFVLGTVFDSY